MWEQIQIFDRTEVICILEGIGMPESRIMGWTRDWKDNRTLQIQGSIRTGSKVLYSVDDIHRFGLAWELRKAGLAAKPIGKIVNKLGKQLKDMPFVTLSRTREGGDYSIVEGKSEPQTLAWITVNVGDLVTQLQRHISIALEKRK